MRLPPPQPPNHLRLLLLYLLPRSHHPLMKPKKKKRKTSKTTSAPGYPVASSPTRPSASQPPVPPVPPPVEAGTQEVATSTLSPSEALQSEAEIPVVPQDDVITDTLSQVENVPGTLVDIADATPSGALGRLPTQSFSYCPPASALLPLLSVKDQVENMQMPPEGMCLPSAWASPSLSSHGTSVLPMSFDPSTDPNTLVL